MSFAELEVSEMIPPQVSNAADGCIRALLGATMAGYVAELGGQPWMTVRALVVNFIACQLIMQPDKASTLDLPCWQQQNP